jgi:hypothetical protein
VEFGTEMAAPVLRLRTPTGTGANSSTKSANGSRAIRRGKNKNLSFEGKARESLWRLPLVGDDHRGRIEKLWRLPLVGDGYRGQIKILWRLPLVGDDHRGQIEKEIP